MHYEVGTLGNHEFNYGLDYLADAIKQAKFPIINANVVKVGTEEPYFTPYVIQTKEVVDSQGKKHKLNIGYIGFVPPQIMVWDKANLQGKVENARYRETAQKYVPEMKQKAPILLWHLLTQAHQMSHIKKVQKTQHSTLLMYHTLTRLFSVTLTVYSQTKSSPNHQMQILLKVP